MAMAVLLSFRTLMFKKILAALAALPRSLRPVRHPKLVMTLLVKNEEEMLAENLEFHRTMGVDGFIITDNNSTDATPQIIEHYRQKGWVLDVIRETATDYNQKRWVDRMVLLAKKKYGADWVVNADADEFWYSPNGSLKAGLSEMHANVLQCAIVNVLPEAHLSWTEWRRTVRCVPNLEEYDLSVYSIFNRQTQKVMHRTDGYLQISMGNHKVKMLPQFTSRSDITIYHYNIRGKKQFVDKMVNGGRQLEQRKQKHGGRHWRYFYALYKQGLLEAEYDRVVGTHVLAQLEQEGYVLADNPVPGILEHLPNRQNPKAMA